MFSYPLPPHPRHCIPPEICTAILSYLPVKSLLRFRSVSKEWKSIIDNPDFASLHLSNYSNNCLDTHVMVLQGHGRPWYPEYPEYRAKWFSSCHEPPYYEEATGSDFPVQAEILTMGNRHSIIAGDINGLLLVQKTHSGLGSELSSSDNVFLWNPSIRKSLGISHPQPLWKYVCLFLGYDPSTNNYKVLAMGSHDEGSEGPSITLDIFSLNSLSWSGERSCSRLELNCTSMNGNRVSLDRYVYWVGKHYSSDNKTGFVSFNMTNETFSLVPLPYISMEPSDNRIYVTDQPVVVAGSHIGLLTTYRGNSNIWVLEKDDSWSKRFTINLTLLFRVWNEHVNLNKYGVLIWPLVINDDAEVCLNACDLKTGKSSVVAQREDTKWWPIYCKTYIESLVLLNY